MGTKASRKPTLELQYVGSSACLLGERQLNGKLAQPPPRYTRAKPDCAPIGSTLSFVYLFFQKTFSLF